jgi:hypothetical protein
MSSNKEFPPLKEVFLIEEFRACRERISKEIDAISSIESNFLIASGAIIAFGFTQNINILRICFIFVTAIGFYGLWRYNTHRKVIRIHEVYIIDEVESVVQEKKNISDSMGMMAHYEANKSKSISEIGRNENSGGLKLARFALWITMISIPILLLLFSFCAPEHFKALITPIKS